jgi:acyl-coenzyme A thioesterase PaaI-like protein
MLDKVIPHLKAAQVFDPAGLQLDFTLNDGIARTRFRLSENHQGPGGHIHDGIIALIMDQGMGWITRHCAHVSSVTARLEVNYHQRARIGEPLVMNVCITKNSKRLLEETARIEREDGTLIAEGTCLQYTVNV